jgi:hypothetical protein
MDGYVDLAFSAEEMKARESDNSPLSEVPKYPYGLSISLDEKTLAKLNVEHSEWNVGDVFPVDVLLKVTGKNVSETADGEKCCINMQITAMKGEEEPKELEEASEHEAYTRDGHGKNPALEKHGYLRHGAY